MANENRISVVITADASGAITGLRMAGDATERFSGQSATYLSRLKSHWLEVTAGITAAYLAAEKMLAYVEAYAQHEEAMRSLDAMAKTHGQTAEGLVAKISEVSHGLIGQATAATVAGDALMKGIIKPEQLSAMASWSVTLSHVSGGTMKAGEAFRLLEESISSARERGLRKFLGASVDVEAHLGRQYESMSKAERAAAAYNIVGQRMAQVQAVMGKETDSVADKIDRARNQFEEYKRTVGEFIVRLGYGLMATFQSVSAIALGLARVVMAPITALTLATDYLGITTNKAQEYQQAMEALGSAGLDLAEKANANFKLMWEGLKEPSGGKAGGFPPLGGGEDDNRKHLEKLTDLFRQYNDERGILQASEYDKELIAAEKWKTEQLQKLDELRAGQRERAAMQALYEEKVSEATRKRQTQITDFYITEQKRLDAERDKAEKARISEQFAREEAAVRSTSDRNIAHAKAWGESESEIIRMRASGEVQILEVRQRALIASITEQATFEETLGVMARYQEIEREIASIKEREVTELDSRRIEAEREILEITRKQLDVKREAELANMQAAFSAIGGGEAGKYAENASRLAAGMEDITTGTDPYSVEFQQWSALQDLKIQKLIELGSTEAQLKDEYRQYDLIQEEMHNQQKVALAANAFGMMAGLMQGIYSLQGQKGGAAFELMKAFRIGETVMNTYSAAVGAYNAMAGIPIIGPALGAAAAAAAIAFGMAQVRSIASMKPGGAAASSSVPSARGMAAAPSVGSAPVAAATEEKTISSPVVNVHIYGNVVDHDAFAREIVPSITKAISDGVQ